MFTFHFPRKRTISLLIFYRDIKIFNEIKNNDILFYRMLFQITIILMLTSLYSVGNLRKKERICKLRMPPFLKFNIG